MIQPKIAPQFRSDMITGVTVASRATQRGIKRGVDIIGALFGLVVLSPLFVVIAFLVWRTDGGSAFYSQARVGRGGRVFRCYKFRSMHVDAEAMLEGYLAENPAAAEEWALRSKLLNDPRITRIGHFIRRTSIDELPQLLNVLKGDMSLVGPRAIPTYEADRWGHALRVYQRVRPGMTGHWVTNGRSATSYAERIRFETEYVRSWSLALDTKILLRTVPVLISGDGAA